MRKLTKESTDRVLKILRDPGRKPEYSDTALTFRADHLTVNLTGRVFLHGLCVRLPMDYHDRRKVSRAAKRRHALITEQIIRLGLPIWFQHQRST